ncbi:hypothetical protein Q9966_012939 [Columba livia]|nr:hypothetical protein Q9966_012939 [Columba livia]
MADKHLTCPMVAQEEDRAPQESSSPAEPQELCMAQDLEMVVAEGMAPPQRILFPPEKIRMAWQHSQRAGAGLHNLGNTCFLNSVLQCLTYTPPLANHLLSGEHSRACGQKGFCVMCRMEVHVQQVLHSSASAIEPWAVVDFLTVTCWSCQAVSDSYEAFLDVPLDIKAAASVTAALEDFVKPEHLDGENCFKCSKCDKVTAASKRFTVHRAPKVLTVCLKRFEAFTGDKISKVVEYPQYLDLRPYMSQAAGEPLLYSLYAVLVHGGGSCRAGHYFCYIKASDGLWYHMDDKSVDLCDSVTVLRQQAYLLFYISADCRASSRLGLSLELGELQGVLSPDSSRPVKFSVCQSIWETSDPFLDLVLEISVSDQVKKAVTNRPRSSPVTGQRSILWKASRSDHCTPPHSQFANHTYPMDTTHPNSLACWKIERKRRELEKEVEILQDTKAITQEVITVQAERRYELQDNVDRLLACIAKKQREKNAKKISQQTSGEGILPAWDSGAVSIHLLADEQDFLSPIAYGDQIQQQYAQLQTVRGPDRQDIIAPTLYQCLCAAVLTAYAEPVESVLSQGNWCTMEESIDLVRQVGVVYALIMRSDSDGGSSDKCYR